LTDNSGPGLESPKLLAGCSIQGLEPALHRSIEDDIPRRDDCAAPHGKLLFDRPDFLTGADVPSCEFAAVTAGPRLHMHVGADEGGARDIADLRLDDIHAEIVVRQIDEPVFV